MKMNKKTIIILIVVAVAVFLLWRSSKKKSEGAGGNAAGDTDTTTLNYILSNIDFTTEERNRIMALKNRVETDAAYRASIQSKATANGRSFDQQMVLDAIWLIYHPAEEWLPGPDGSTSYGWILQKKVLNLK